MLGEKYSLPALNDEIKFIKVNVYLTQTVPPSILYGFVSIFTEFWPLILIKFQKYWKLGEFSTYIIYGALCKILKNIENAYGNIYAERQKNSLEALHKR